MSTPEEARKIIGRLGEIREHVALYGYTSPSRQIIIREALRKEGRFTEQFIFDDMVELIRELAVDRK